MGAEASEFCFPSENGGRCIWDGSTPGLRAQVASAARTLRNLTSPTVERTQSSTDDHFRWADLDSEVLLKEILEGAGKSESVFPLRLPPPPPKPSSKSGRVRSRHVRSWVLWKDVYRVLAVFNDILNNPSGAEVSEAGWSQDASTDQHMTVSGPLSDDAVAMLDLDGLPVGAPARFKHVVQVDALTRCYWSEVASAMQRVQEGRRHSLKGSGTGVLLLTRLRKTLADLYGRTTTTSPYRPFISSLIKENPKGSPVVDGLGYIGGVFAATINEESQMLRTLTAEEEVSWAAVNKTYDIFGGPRQEWIRYLQSDAAHDLWHYDFADQCKACTGIVAVGRSKDDKLRKILAAIPFNLRMRLPKDVFDRSLTELGMYGPGALAAVSAPSGSIGWVALDESQAFTSVAAPRWFWPYQGGPSVRASNIPRYFWPPGADAESLLRPQYKRLAMGNTWSVLILVVLHMEVCRRSLETARALPLRTFQIINQAMTAGVTLGLNSKNGVVYIHVDDMLFGHEQHRWAHAAAVVVKAELQRIGFIVDMTVFPDKLVGVEPQCEPALLLPPLRRLGDLDRALESIEGRDRLHPPLVATVLGIWNWFALLWRPSMSMATSIYKWVEIFREANMAPVWKSVRRDLQRMRVMLPFLKANLSMATIPLLFSQDAAGGSPGTIQGRHGSFALSIGAVSRECLTYVLSRIVVKGLNPTTVQEDSGTLDVLPRTLLPTEVAHAPWWTIIADRFRYSLHINEGESRSALRWAHIFLQRRRLWKLRWVDVSDSSATVGSWAKGRSPKFHLNKLQQRRAVYEGISGSRAAQCWIGTEDQTSDWGTREGLALLLGQSPNLFRVPPPTRAVAVICWSAGPLLKQWCRTLSDGFSNLVYAGVWEATKAGDNCLVTSKGWARLRSWLVTGRLCGVCILAHGVPEGIDDDTKQLWLQRCSATLQQFSEMSQELSRPLLVGVMSSSFSCEIVKSLAVNTYAPVKTCFRSSSWLEVFIHHSLVSTKEKCEERLRNSQAAVHTALSTSEIFAALCDEVVEQTWSVPMPSEASGASSFQS